MLKSIVQKNTTIKRCFYVFNAGTPPLREHCATKSKVRFTKTGTWPWPLSSCSGRLTGVENEKNLAGLLWPPEIQPGGEQGHPQPRGCNLEHFFITQGYNKKLTGSFCTHFRSPRTPWGPEMAHTWPSGSSPGPGNDFWAKIHKKELIPGKKQRIWC